MESQHVLPHIADELPLPEGWKTALPEADRKWVSKALCGFNAQGRVEVRANRLWYYPPEPALIPSQCPVADRYFAHRLLVWMPRRLFKVRLHCPDEACEKHELTSAGNYPGVRHVLDVADYYIMVTEYLRCSRCEGKYIGWSNVIVKQLDEGHRRLFPVVLTYR